MAFPFEILTLIAAELNSSDLASFRLVNHAFAAAGAPTLPRNGFSVLNASKDLKTLYEIVKYQDIANNTKKVRIFHLEWPLETLAGWTSPAYFKSSVTKYVHVQETTSQEKDGRRLFDAVQELSDLFTILPNVDSISVATLHDCFWSSSSNHRYKRLQHTIWASPFHYTEVAGTLEQLFLTPVMRRIRDLQIFGCLDPSTIFVNNSSMKFGNVVSLTVQGLRMSNDVATCRFLACFPNLEEFSISFHGWGPTQNVLESMVWPRMKNMRLDSLWISEDEFLHIFQSHVKSLETFEISECSLTQGSWKGLFTRIRSETLQVTVTAHGELFGRTARETLQLDRDNIALLQCFMKDRRTSWPFFESIS